MRCALGPGHSLLTQATYTANLASILTAEKQRISVATLGDAIKLKVPICGSRKQTASTRAAFPEAVWAVRTLTAAFCAYFAPRNYPRASHRVSHATRCGQIDPKDGEIGILSRSDLLSNIDAGVCGCAIMPLQDLEVFHANGQHCDKTPVGQSIDVLFQGFPVHGSVASALHHVVVDARSTGQLRDLMEANNPLGVVGRWMTKSLAAGEKRPDKCMITDGEDESDENLSLTPSDLMGSFLLLAFFIGFALIVHLFQLLASKLAAGGRFDFKKNHPEQVAARASMPRPRYNSCHVMIKGESVPPPTFHRASLGTDTDLSQAPPRGSVHEVMSLLESTAEALKALPGSSLQETLPQAPHPLQKRESEVQKVMERIRRHRVRRKKNPTEASASHAQSDGQATSTTNEDNLV